RPEIMPHYPGLQTPAPSCSTSHGSSFDPDAATISGDGVSPTAMAAASGSALGRAVATCATDAGLASADVKASSAKLRSLADWNRCSGFFARQHRTILDTTGEIFGLVSLRSGGSMVKIEFMTSTAESPENGRHHQVFRRGRHRARKCPCVLRFHIRAPAR